MEHRQVREVMTTKPVTVLSTTSLKSLADVLVKLGVNAVPVVSAEGKVLGLITEMDLLRKEGLQQDPASSRLPRRSSQRQRLIATAETTGELMRTHPVMVRPDTPVAEAARLMERHQLACLPVVDESERLLGVVGPRNLLRILLRPDEEEERHSYLLQVARPADADKPDTREPCPTQGTGDNRIPVRLESPLMHCQ